jgi:hypothetical protein
VNSMTNDEAAREVKEILDSVDMHDATFTVPALRSALVVCHDYLNGSRKLSSLIWHLKRIRNRCLVNDAQESGDRG